MEKEQTVKFNNKTYEWNKLSEKSKLFFGQLRDLDTQIVQARMKIDQLHMSRHGFTNALANELGEKISAHVHTDHAAKPKANFSPFKSRENKTN